MFFDNYWSLFDSLTFHHSVKSLPLRLKDGETISLANFCQRLTRDCRLDYRLYNGHLQTLWTCFQDQTPSVYFMRKTFLAEEEAFAGSFTVDFVTGAFKGEYAKFPPRTRPLIEGDFCQMKDNPSPIVVILHGLNGGSHESYIQSFIAELKQKNPRWDGAWSLE